MESKLKQAARRAWKRIVTHFLQGLFLFSPVAITAYSIYWVFITLDNQVNFKIPGLGIMIPGLGIIMLFGIILLIGFLGSNLLFQPLWKAFDSFLYKFPITRFIYPALKDIFGAVVGKDKKLNKPVLFRISKDSDLERIGFVTETDLGKLGIGKEKVAVYAPHSYNFSGNVYIVPVENIQPLDVDPAEAMKFVVAGGMVKVKGQDREKEETKIYPE